MHKSDIAQCQNYIKTNQNLQSELFWEKEYNKISWCSAKLNNYLPLSKKIKGQKNTTVEKYRNPKYKPAFFWEIEHSAISWGSTCCARHPSTSAHMNLQTIWQIDNEDYEGFDYEMIIEVQTVFK